MGKHAYLIIAHDDWKLLSKLIESLDDSRNEIFIHIDKKSKDFNINKIYNPKNAECTYIKRQNISWGGYSQISVEMRLILVAMQKEKFDYLHLLSGHDLPLKSQNEIHDWFDRQHQISFIALDKIPQHQSAIRDRCSMYYFFQEYAGRGRNLYQKCIRKFDYFLCLIQKIFKIDRVKNYKKIYKGHNWFSITGEMAEEVLRHSREIKKHFKFTFCADEVFLQTIAYNSKLNDKIVDNSLRAIDWNRGNPYIYKIDDIDMLLASKYLFARKFCSDVDNNVINVIFNKIKE